MQNISAGPQCTLEGTFLDGATHVCPDCAPAWPATESVDAAQDGDASEKSLSLP